MKRALLLCALGAATAVLAAGPAHADSFTVTFSGSIGSGHNQNSISGTVDFDAPAGGGSITDPTGSILFTSGQGYNFHSDTYTVIGLSAFGSAPEVYADNTLDFDGTNYFFDENGLGLNLSGNGQDVNLHSTFSGTEKADDGNIGIFIIVPFNDINDVFTVSETITDNSINTPPPSPTPEPGSLALLGTAILGGAGALRRRFIA